MREEKDLVDMQSSFRKAILNLLVCSALAMYTTADIHEQLDNDASKLMDPRSKSDGFLTSNTFTAQHFRLPNMDTITLPPKFVVPKLPTLPAKLPSIPDTMPSLPATLPSVPATMPIDPITQPSTVIGSPPDVMPPVPTDGSALLPGN